MKTSLTMYVHGFNEVEIEFDSPLPLSKGMVIELPTRFIPEISRVRDNSSLAAFFSSHDSVVRLEVYKVTLDLSKKEVRAEVGQPPTNTLGDNTREKEDQMYRETARAVVKALEMSDLNWKWKTGSAENI